MTTSLLELGPTYHRTLALETRKGRPIPNFQRLEMNPSQAKAVIRIIKKACPNAKMRSITQVYNCLGMAFASRRTWIDEDSIGLILEDDDYKLVNKRADVQQGDLITYWDSTTGEFKHVGIILGEKPLIEGSKKTLTWVLSQFGAGGEWIHPINEVPEGCNGTIRVYTDRR
ncbi:MAG: hypothetical protein V3W14_09925 [Candidatus Neomarinimicrobiota bacterium]